MAASRVALEVASSRMGADTVAVPSTSSCSAPIRSA